MLKRFPRRGWLVILLIFGVLSVAYLSSFIFHHGEQILLLDWINPNPPDPLVTWMTNTCGTRFCEAVCPTGYFAFAGRCSSSGGKQWNLAGVSTNFVSWQCFDSSLINYSGDPSYPIITVDAMCIKVGNVAGPPIKIPGNYVIDTGEVCDMNNTGNLDCTDFTYNGNQLCNGWLTCNATGTGYDISHCELCAPGYCYPKIQCKDGSCANNCPDDSGGAYPSGVGVPPAGAVCGNNFVEPPESCDDGGFVAGDGCSALCQNEVGGYICGNGIVEPENLEECDNEGAESLTGTTYMCAGPPPHCIYGVVVCENCKWHDHTPDCGDGTNGGPFGGLGAGENGGGTCNSTGLASHDI